MKRWMIITIIVVCVLGLGGFLLRGKLLSATKESATESATADLKTAVVERGDIQVTIDATGTIKPLNTVEVNSKASGKILELAVDAGDYVEEGDVIARIETTYVQVEVDQAEADLRAAKAPTRTSANQYSTAKGAIWDSDCTGRRIIQGSPKTPGTTD